MDHVTGRCRLLYSLVESIDLSSKKEYTLFMEVSNDQAILQNSSRKEHIQYANLIVSTAKTVHYRQCAHHALSMNFVGKSPSNLRTRIKFITTDFTDEKRKIYPEFFSQHLSLYC